MKLVSVSLFDLDSTLYKGQQGYVILDFPIFLEKRGLFEQDTLQKLEDLKSLYQDRKIERTPFVLQLIEFYYRGITHQPVVKIEQAAHDFWLQMADSAWFTYSIELVNFMNKITRTILVSGSSLVPLRYIQQQFCFDELHATTGIIEHGVFTGAYRREDERATSEAKDLFVNALSTQLQIDRETSFAFGDSESDIPLLKAVIPDNGFVLGAKNGFSAYAKEQGWNILNYSDNIMEVVRKRVLQITERKVQ